MQKGQPIRRRKFIVLFASIFKTTLMVKPKIGFAIHGLLAFAMIGAAVMKALGKIEPSAGLEAYTPAVVTGEIISAVLLLIPRTLSVGLLLTSAFWGGAIVVNMVAPEEGLEWLTPATLLLMTWVGSALRDPRALFRNLDRQKNSKQ